jgi:hypothetical protein
MEIVPKTVNPRRVRDGQCVWIAILNNWLKPEHPVLPDLFSAKAIQGPSIVLPVDPQPDQTSFTTSMHLHFWDETEKYQ